MLNDVDDRRQQAEPAGEQDQVTALLCQRLGQRAQHAADRPVDRGVELLSRHLDGRGLQRRIDAPRCGSFEGTWNLGEQSTVDARDRADGDRQRLAITLRGSQHLDG